MLDKKEHKGEVIDFKLFTQIIDRIIEQRIINNLSPHRLTLVFHGGEVLIVGKEKFYQMAEYASTKMRESKIEFELAMQTNMTLLDEEFARILGKFEINVGLSFDGIDGANNGRTSIKQKTFEDKFDLLERNKVQYGFLLVASKLNADKFDDTKLFLESLDSVKSYKINYAEDIVNPGEQSEIEMPGSEMFEKIFKPEIDRYIANGHTYEFHTVDLIQKSVVDILTWHEDAEKTGCNGKFCGAGIYMIAIHPDGEMDHCDRYSKQFPIAYVQHALDYDFLGIHQLKRAVDFAKIRHDLLKKSGCDTCYARYVCENGCMAFYYSKFGEYGIDKRVVCDQFKQFYGYVLMNIQPILNMYIDKGMTIDSNDRIFQVKRYIPSYLNDRKIRVHLNQANQNNTLSFERIE
jgi:uncharacterized protein